MTNGLFELVGSLMLWSNVRQLIKDKEVKGINWWTVIFFTSFGIWNLFYYPSLNQWYSFLGGISIAIANTTWLILLVYYKGLFMKFKKYLTLRNVLILPVVLLIRAPIIIFLLMVIALGKFADTAFDYCDYYLPSIKDKGQ